MGGVFSEIGKGGGGGLNRMIEWGERLCETGRGVISKHFSVYHR